MAKADVILIRNAASDDFGGAERYAIFLAEELKKHSIKPLVLSAHHDILQFASSRLVENSSAPWLKKQNWDSKHALLLPLYFLWQVRLFCFYVRILRQTSAKVIHPQSKDDFIAATYAGKLLNRRVVWTDHADLKHIFKNTNKFGRNLTGKLVLRASKHADKIILNSLSDKKAIEHSVGKNHFFWKKTIVIHNGVGDQKGHYSVKKPSETFTFITNCRVVTAKGIGEVIVAFKKVHKNWPKSRLVIMGDGPDRKHFEDLAKDHRAITFFGHQDDPLAFLAQADCFLQPTYHEGLSLSLVEACMLQKPIITTAVGGNPEVITNGKNGLLIPPRDVTALIQAMKEVLQHPVKVKKMAKNARETFEKKFNFSKIVNQKILPIYSLKSTKK